MQNITEEMRFIILEIWDAIRWEKCFSLGGVGGSESEVNISPAVLPKIKTTPANTPIPANEKSQTKQT